MFFRHIIESAEEPIIGGVIHYVQFGWPMEKTLSLTFDLIKIAKWDEVLIRIV